MDKVRRSFGDLALVCAGFPLAGAGLGWLAYRFSDWLADAPWMPARQAVRWLTGFPEPWSLVSFIAAGTVLALLLTATAFWEYVVIGVENDELIVRRGDKTRRAHRAEISIVFAEESGGLTSKELVVLGRTGAELWRVRGDLPPRRNIAALLTERGFPWRPDGDPYRADYRRWVDGLPDLPPGANALLSARQRALSRGDRDDADQLRAELSRLGIALRDEKDRQHWRQVPE